MRWFEVNANPNSPAVLQLRQEALNYAWRCVPPKDRLEYIERHCRGRVVLDVGCTGHEGDMPPGGWLHARIKQVAARCVGIDINENAVKKVQDDGFDVLCFDVLLGSEAAKRVLGEAQFDVVVAGEVIEHLRDPLALLEVAAVTLRGGGKLIITTPNPYAPHRAFSGRTRYAWENADHLFYIFPSGIVEMAERTGLQLAESCTVEWDDRRMQLRRSIRLQLRHSIAGARGMWRLRILAQSLTGAAGLNVPSS